MIPSPRYNGANTPPKPIKFIQNSASEYRKLDVVLWHLQHIIKKQILRQDLSNQYNITHLDERTTVLLSAARVRLLPSGKRCSTNALDNRLLCARRLPVALHEPRRHHAYFLRSPAVAILQQKPSSQDIVSKEMSSQNRKKFDSKRTSSY
jgi:hypothetical protein